MSYQKTSGTDTTYQNEKTINKAFTKVIASILNDDDLAAALRGFIRSKEQ